MKVTKLNENWKFWKEDNAFALAVAIRNRRTTLMKVLQKHLTEGPKLY